jgi:hypothetical protein
MGIVEANRLDDLSDIIEQDWKKRKGVIDRDGSVKLAPGLVDQDGTGTDKLVHDAKMLLLTHHSYRNNGLEPTHLSRGVIDRYLVELWKFIEIHGETKLILPNHEAPAISTIGKAVWKARKLHNHEDYDVTCKMLYGPTGKPYRMNAQLIHKKDASKSIQFAFEALPQSRTYRGADHLKDLNIVIACASYEIISGVAMSKNCTQSSLTWSYDYGGVRQVASLGSDPSLDKLVEPVSVVHMFGTPMEKSDWHYGLLPKLWSPFGCLGKFPMEPTVHETILRFDLAICNPPFEEDSWTKVMRSSVWSCLTCPVMMIVHKSQPDNFWSNAFPLTAMLRYSLHVPTQRESKGQGKGDVATERFMTNASLRIVGYKFQ